MSTLDELVVRGIGGTDSYGDRGPAGGTHTGLSLITMQDGAQFTVSHALSEVLTKTDQHVMAPGTRWIAFDTPGNPVVLNAELIATVVTALPIIVPSRPVPGMTWPVTVRDALLTAEYVIAAVQEATAWQVTASDALATTELVIAAVTAATWQAADIDEALAAEFAAAVIKYVGLFPGNDVLPRNNQLPLPIS